MTTPSDSKDKKDVSDEDIYTPDYSAKLPACAYTSDLFKYKHLILGGGQYKSVYAGKWHERDVAVAYTRFIGSGSDFQKMAKKWYDEQICGKKLVHPGICQTLECIMDKNGYSCRLVMERLNGKTMHTYISLSMVQWSPKNRLHTMLSVAKTITYLNNTKQYPSDISPRHWVDVVPCSAPNAPDAPEFKMVDFLQGTKNQWKEIEHSIKFQNGWSYVSPEYLRGDFDELCAKRPDAPGIYSCAILFYEICTGKLAYSELFKETSYQIVTHVATNKKRPVWPLDNRFPECHPLRELIEKMWVEDPLQRPTMSEVVSELSKWTGQQC